MIEGGDIAEAVIDAIADAVPGDNKNGGCGKIIFLLIVVAVIIIIYLNVK